MFIADPEPGELPHLRGEQAGAEPQRALLRGGGLRAEGEEEEGQAGLRHRGGLRSHQEDVRRPDEG